MTSTGTVVTHYRSMTVRRALRRATFAFADDPDNVVATASHAHRKWLLRIPGHNWPVTPDMATTRFNKLPGDKITRTPVKAFPSWQACVKEIESIVTHHDAI